ncbi:MAG: DUF493 domain-containing protein [Desulfuromonadaceae bacterium]
MTSIPTEELFAFPCDHLFKAFGPNDETFVSDVCAAVAAVTPLSRDALKLRPSSGGAHQCVSILLMLQNYVQLQQLYAALRQVPRLKFLL